MSFCYCIVESPKNGMADEKGWWYWNPFEVCMFNNLQNVLIHCLIFSSYVS